MTNNIDEINKLDDSYKKMIAEMVDVIVNGDGDLSPFPESKEKTELLEYLDNAKKSFESRPTLSSEQITELKEKLSLSSDEDKVKIILDIVDTTVISIELKEVLAPYKHLLTEIRKANKDGK